MHVGCSRMHARCSRVLCHTPRYANRAKSITLKARKNESMTEVGKPYPHPYPYP